MKHFWALDKNQICLGMVDADCIEKAKKLLERKLTKEGLLEEWNDSGRLIDFFDSTNIQKSSKRKR